MLPSSPLPSLPLPSPSASLIVVVALALTLAVVALTVVVALAFALSLTLACLPFPSSSPVFLIVAVARFPHRRRRPRSSSSSRRSRKHSEEPKAIPWTLETPFKANADGWCHMDICKGDVVAWPTNIGWMMGPWLVYASLLNGASLALYNGSPLGLDLPSLFSCFEFTGEASTMDEYLWLMGRAYYKPVIDYCGGTVIGSSFITRSLLLPQCLSAFSTPCLGCDLFILGSDGIPIP